MRVFRSFENFFGTNNPFSVLQETVKQNATLASSGPPAQVINLECTLEELYTGCIKRPAVERLVVSGDGRDQTTESIHVDVVLKSGYLNGTSITFPKKGDVLPGMEPSDLTFVVNEAPHDKYHRVGNDILYTANITLAQALGRCELSLVHLDGRCLNVDCNRVITPNSKVIVPGEGFPSVGGGSSSKGDLIVDFNIRFPEHLTLEEQDSIGAVLAKKFRK